ncbi:hypothetical protein CRG98_004101 [Punica granatum]|uniref:Uncharacterized protein n=1 Tax=Punica granatum TaxID=22663 RepID=A0A2I0L403_PUNGR|nr:hypothetical protein CRG98_004101 [Punica granatum]
MAHSTRFGFQVSTRLTVTVESGRLKLPVTFPGREENRNFPFASPFHWNRSRERSRDSLEKFQSSESCPNSTPLSQSPPESSSSEPNSNRSSRGDGPGILSSSSCFIRLCVIYCFFGFDEHRRTDPQLSSDFWMIYL